MTRLHSIADYRRALEELNGLGDLPADDPRQPQRRKLQAAVYDFAERMKGRGMEPGRPDPRDRQTH